MNGPAGLASASVVSSSVGSGPSGSSPSSSSTLPGGHSSPPRRDISPNTAAAESLRKRQSRKDEAIRRKFEVELGKKKTRGRTTRGDSSNRVPGLPRTPGTVAALRPTQALTVRDSLTILEVSQLMAAKRADCVLVVDREEHLAGIFTAKDLAFRVVADGLDARQVLVRDIMTRGPMCVTADAPAIDALTTMVERHFRHLPVCNEEGDVVGLLDITKCMRDALEKMEKVHGYSRKLYEAMEGVQSECSSMQNAGMLAFIEQLQERMACPDLASVMDEDTGSAVGSAVRVKNSVREAARVMRERNVTAVLVLNEAGSLAGIFTSKDIVLRVIAAGLNPDNCSVVRVMTPEPYVASPSMSIIDALRQMHAGHYLNLPVVEDGAILGVVDVLRLTCTTLEQINTLQNGGLGGEGPVWNRFFALGNEDSESQLSGSATTPGPGSVYSRGPGAGSGGIPGPTDSRRGLESGVTGESMDTGEIFPEESASMTGAGSRVAQESASIAFKLTDPRPNGQAHRFVAGIGDFEGVRATVWQRLGLRPGTEDGQEGVRLGYVDEDGDPVILGSGADLTDAVSQARRSGKDRVQLVLFGLEKSSTSRSDPSGSSPSSRRSHRDYSPEPSRSSGRGRKDSHPFGGTGDGLPSNEMLMGGAVGLSVALIMVLVVLKLR
ncbi:MAG: CBS and PB1 domain-containing protein [Piptocephalis tieghemiana]|nr:MAG: CBS and PB1 domain-containing protein [Piptocephalis tieghemiana]